ncbi:BTAD domain-containing putative transcriptional regulator, partial [Streptomyces sp. NPDC020875]|uniref:AfsR/SARP family transcriptional regulator n=1 Tax=Streptomyces sp. NPDC020875 TaxID=3154898 RepID=UPI0033DD9AB8
MRYSVLGTTQAHRDDGTPVPLGGVRLRALLGALALRAGRTVPVGALVTEVWAGEPPADPTGALQALVGRLRRTIGAGAVVSAADGGGYRLVADPDDIDLHRFTRLTGEGARALADGDPAKAGIVLEEALALWRGPALADLPDAGAEATRADIRRRTAVRDRLAALVALGRAEESLPELVAAGAGAPLDEPLRALHVRALRAAGRPAEALAAYEEFRVRLADRLGTEPGPELRGLYEELLDPGRAPDTGAGPDRTTATADGADPGRAARREPAGGSAVPPPGNLRARLTSFVGREDDIDALRADLRGSRLVTLIGPGGAGKTRLSQEAGARTAEAYPDGVWLVELAPVDDPRNVPEAVLSALGAQRTVLRGAGAEEMRAAELTSDDPLSRLVEFLRRRRLLLVLDNCEHVVGAAAVVVERV